MAAIVAGVAFVITGGSLQGGLRPLVAVLVAVALAALSYLGVEMLLRSEEVGLVRSVIRRDRSRV
jgi:peptidoglycan/LPS O-acetylase OafA/YrhL